MLSKHTDWLVIAIVGLSIGQINAQEKADVETPTEIYTLLFRQQSLLEVSGKVKNTVPFLEAKLSPIEEPMTGHSLPEER